MCVGVGELYELEGLKGAERWPQGPSRGRKGGHTEPHPPPPPAGGGAVVDDPSLAVENFGGWEFGLDRTPFPDGDKATSSLREGNL